MEYRYRQIERFKTMLFLLRMLIQTIAILVIAYLFPFVMKVEGFVAALAAAFVLGLINTVLKPLFVFFTLPLTIMTFGFFLLVINGLLLWMVSAIVPGFQVSGFFGALLGSIMISLVTWILSRVVR